MSKKKRIDRSTQDDGPLQSPFAGLQGLRASLPSAASDEQPLEANESASSRSPSTRSAPAFEMKRAVLRRERAGRGGKTVVKIENTDLALPQLSALAKAVKKKLGCGATVEGEAVVVLGDLEDRIEDLLRAEGVKHIVRATKK